ncbi:hypothetical protein [Actinomadura rayongensis]|uniref:Uncharacterized protein n=1 Tax=Actinomadura rayongensis TaxID=1429076 RepID=A0A6I4WDQ1_9ACTN|nr:hypothetical protein [Actinomadura rayongensis]MXQ67868.1 hypothetical protein [Actinomadura rayongensis]
MGLAARIERLCRYARGGALDDLARDLAVSDALDRIRAAVASGSFDRAALEADLDALEAAADTVLDGLGGTHRALPRIDIAPSTGLDVWMCPGRICSRVETRPAPSGPHECSFRERALDLVRLPT